MKRIILYENMRALPYVPFYLAQAQGVFAAEGLDLDLKRSPSTVETAKGVLEGRADIAWGGPMRVMMHHDADPECPLVCFCQVVARDPFLLVGREPNPTFRFSDLEGLRVGIATEVPTPWMTFQEDLRQAGLDPLLIDGGQRLLMSENVSALREGKLDVVQVFEPYADDLISSGTGHLWHRFSIRGEIAYTTFYTTRQFVESHWETCQALTRAMTQTQKWLKESPGADVAKIVSRYFPDFDLKYLARIIESYQGAGLWSESPEVPVSAFVRLKTSLLSGGLIRYDVPYQRAIVNVLSDQPADKSTV